MARKITVTIDLEVADDTGQEQLDELLGAVSAQLEDDEAGALEGFSMRAAGIPGWDDQQVFDK